MASLLASMRDDDGRILIDGFTKNVRPLSKSERAAIADVPNLDEQLRKELSLGATEANNAKLIERIHQPALNIRGMSAGPTSSAANAIATQAWASIDFRLVPNQTAAEVQRLVEKHLEKRGYFIAREIPDPATLRAHPKVIRVVWTHEGYAANRTSLDAPSSMAVIAVVRAAADAPIVVLPTQGGSLPAYLFPEVLKSDVIMVPTVNYDNSQHAANENVRIGHLWDAVEIFGVMLVGLRTDW
jgi:acetylornithine deacetylase/succinyl-diaminopimelate desuccinylase-like protein